MGVRAAGGVRGVRDGPARQWCRRAMVTHRVVAWVAASAALYACALMVASTRQRDALSPAGVTIATLVYVSFAVILIVRWPPWLLAAVTTAGAVASMAAGTPDLLVGPALVAGMFVFSLRSERTPAIAGTAAVIGVLLAGHLVFSLHAKTGWSDVAVVPWTAVAASPAELFGRDRELATLREAWRSAVDGRPMLVVVSGPPGGGKTALLDAAAALGGEGGVVAVCCQPENGLQLQPMVELVRSILAIWLPEEFDRADEDGMTLLARLLPEFVSATSAHNGDDPDFAVARRADAAEWVFTRATKLRPLVVIVDDAQWSDNFTLNVLRRLAGSGPGVPLLVIAAARSEYLTPSGQEVNRVAEWYESLTAAMRLELGSLDRASVRSWVASVLPEQLMFRTDALTALALERTGGEPLFVAEMMRALARAVKDLRSFSLADERAMTTLNVRSSFDRRFRKLTNQAQHAVKAAAVIGPVVDLHLLGRVLGDDEDKLVELLDEAVAEGLVVEVAGRLDTYAFQHELLRDFLVQQLGRNRRARLHQLVALALSAAADEGSDRDIALHALLALPLGDVEEVVGLAMKAAERLLKSNAVDEAARMYNRALTATEGQLGPVQRCELLIRLGETQAWSGEPSAAGTTLHAAIDLARELGDGELFARSVLATGNHHRVVNAAGRRLELLQEAYEGLDRRWSGLRVTVAANLLGEAVVPGRSHPVDVEPAVLLAAARAVGEPEPLADALFAVHSSRKAEASVEARHALARELLGLGRAASKTRMVLGGLTCSIYDEVASGRLKAAWTSASELGARASDVGSVRFQWRSLVVRSGLARTQGRADEADQLSRKAHQLGSGYDVADADVVFVMQVHEAYWHGGRLDELRPRFDEAAKRSKLAIAPLLAGQANLAAGGARSAEEIVRRAMPRVLEAARDELWLPTVALAVEVCTSLSLGGFDEPLMKMLLPYSGQWVPVGVPVGTWGPVDRYLGRLALMSGATGEARSFLRHAELQCHEGSSEDARFTALLHHVSLERLVLAYWALSPKAAPGVDGVTWQDYGQDLVANLRDLHDRVHSGRYRARPSRRAYSRRQTGGCGRSASPRWRTRSSSVLSSRYLTPSTRRTSWDSPTGSVRAAARTMRWTRWRSGSSGRR